MCLILELVHKVCVHCHGMFEHLDGNRKVQGLMDAFVDNPPSPFVDHVGDNVLADGSVRGEFWLRNSLRYQLGDKLSDIG